MNNRRVSAAERGGFATRENAFAPIELKRGFRLSNAFASRKYRAARMRRASLWQCGVTCASFHA